MKLVITCYSGLVVERSLPSIRTGSDFAYVGFNFGGSETLGFTLSNALHEKVHNITIYFKLNIHYSSPTRFSS